MMMLVLATIMIGFLIAPASAVLENKTGQVTVFWGRNKNEGSLREACDSGRYTMVIMSFLDVYGHGSKYHLDLSGHPLGRIGADIKHCQFKGVPVSLSIGGFGGHYSLPTKQSALDLFDHLWNAYFGGSKKGVHRPFGDAWLDGVDFFLEHGTPYEHYDVLARELAKHNIRAGPGKLLHLTATPHCKFPDRFFIKKALDTGIFERIHVRFYDDPDCAVFWQQEWEKWTTAYPYTKIYFGLPASPEAAKGGQGYVHPKNVYYGILPVVQTAANYGGVMIWNRYYDKLSDFSSYIDQWA
ncbi:hypothetical protein PR202_gb27494 [Eleusine coracana subsp. coracana]|uniref:GH18 domain-containing protein n=1 Tax=Eleusine coracana subsp. coracana TaxID=191504 RepID=A0AAV5FVI4_ELECO|nr:hypothetical protein QOZ80_4BG0358520 [Eleusine coracana subsp. coracana]GJN38455.1 hypothetical protein PR202_gb27494 [Eleusine coracana subsp. coracana]